MGLINNKALVELPSGWDELIRNTCIIPSPFDVVSCEDQRIVLKWIDRLKNYVLNCPLESRAIKELILKKENSRMIHH